MFIENINAMCLSSDEKFVFAGDRLGQVWVIDTKTFTVLKKLRVHAGTIQVMQAHATENLVTALAGDRVVSVLEYGEDGALKVMLTHSIRDYSPDEFEAVHSPSQALAFHPNLKRLAVRTGNSAIVELDFSDPENIQPQFCIRCHHEMDIVTVRYDNAQGRLLAGCNQGSIYTIQDGRNPTK